MRESRCFPFSCLLLVTDNRHFRISHVDKRPLFRSLWLVALVTIPLDSTESIDPISPGARPVQGPIWIIPFCTAQIMIDSPIYRLKFMPPVRFPILYLCIVRGIALQRSVTRGTSAFSRALTDPGVEVRRNVQGCDLVDPSVLQGG